MLRSSSSYPTLKTQLSYSIMGRIRETYSPAPKRSLLTSEAFRTLRPLPFRPLSHRPFFLPHRPFFLPHRPFFHHIVPNLIEDDMACIGRDEMVNRIKMS